MNLNITKRKRGPLLLLSCTILREDDCQDYLESAPYTITDCAEIRLKFIASKFLATSFSYRISQNTPKDPTIKTYITCSMQTKDGCFTKSYLCDNDWSGFIHIGNEEYTKYFKGVFLYLLEAKFSVQFTKTPPCNLLYNDDSFTDFCLSPENGCGVQVHKAVMAANSEVFKSMLNGEWKETARDCLEVKGTTEKTLQQLKEFMYIGALPDGTDLQPLLLIAKCYMMKDLEQQCAQKLARTVTAEDYTDLVKFAVENRLFGLITAILLHIDDETVNGIIALNKTEIND